MAISLEKTITATTIGDSIESSSHAPTILNQQLLCSSGAHCSPVAGSLVQTDSTTLLATWYADNRQQRPESTETSLWIASYSQNQWSQPREIFAKAGFHIWNPVFLKSRSGELILFFRMFQPKVAEPQKEKYGIRDFVYLSMRSCNGGVSWSEPTSLPEGITGPIKCMPLILHDGSWMVPSAKNGACWLECSHDEGKTWERFGPVQHPDGQSGLTDPCLITDTQGNIKMFFRNRMKTNQDRFVLTATFDLARKTFSSVAQTNVAHPDAGIDVLRLHDGTLVMMANTSNTLRSPLCLLTSKDDGNHWEELLTLESEPGDFAQPALFQTADHRLHILYSWQPEILQQSLQEKNIKHVTIQI